MKSFKEFWKRVSTKLCVIFSVVNWKDVLIRSIKTFFQAAIALIGASLADGSIFQNTGQAVWLSAIAGGIAAVWNGVLSPAFNTLHNKADDEIQ
ncbi:MAG TPA: hypothetical protein PKU80_09810 [Candidatus Limiplasma sp.]|nr:hypothetical protein [Candidatus Limiplasma sp.]